MWAGADRLNDPWLCDPVLDFDDSEAREDCSDRRGGGPRIWGPPDGSHPLPRAGGDAPVGEVVRLHDNAEADVVAQNWFIHYFHLQHPLQIRVYFIWCSWPSHGQFRTIATCTVNYQRR